MFVSRSRVRNREAWFLLIRVVLVMMILTIGSLVGFYFFLQWVIESGERPGFARDDLVVPAPAERPLLHEEPPLFIRGGPTPQFSIVPMYTVNRSAEALDGMEGIGAVLNLEAMNEGPSAIYVESIGYTTGWGASAEGEVGRYIEPGGRTYLRHMLIPIPSPPPADGELTFSLVMDILVEGPVSWARRENLSFEGSGINIIPLAGEGTPPRFGHNEPYFYDKVNDMIRGDIGELEGILEGEGMMDGNFTIQDIVDAYEFVSSRLEYIPDPDTGSNEWISPITCLERGGGDCEDYSILLGSVVTCLGGNSRIVFTEKHAFCAFYLGDDDSVLDPVNERFGFDIPFQIIEDELGKWLVVEPQSQLVFGWFPSDVVVQQGTLEDMYIRGHSDLGWAFESSVDISIVDIYIN